MPADCAVPWENREGRFPVFACVAGRFGVNRRNPVRCEERSMRRLGILAVVGLVVLAGCNRNKPKLTACVDGKPVVERTLDVAPPNCVP